MKAEPGEGQLDPCLANKIFPSMLQMVFAEKLKTAHGTDAREPFRFQSIYRMSVPGKRGFVFRQTTGNKDHRSAFFSFSRISFRLVSSE